MMGSLKISPGRDKGRGRPQSGAPAQNPSSFLGVPEVTTEFHDEPEVLASKVAQLAALIRHSRYFVAFTGAGISHSAGIETYRGPNGFWTRRDKGLPPPKSVALDAARPTLGHMALLAMVRSGSLKHVVSTNVDGLHRRSGLSVDEMSELHGNCYKENCRGCKREYIRNYDASARGVRADHQTGRSCDTCHGPLCMSSLSLRLFHLACLLTPPVSS